MGKKAVLKLTLDNIWTVCEGGPNLLQKIDDVLTFRVPGCEFSPAYKKHVWDGAKHFFRSKPGLVQTGLIPYLLSKLPMDKIDVRFIDKRILPFDPEKLPGRVKWPRITTQEWQIALDYVHFRSNLKKVAYQVDAINESIHNTVSGTHWPRGIIAAATGAGKSLLSAGIIKTLNQPTLFTVNRLDLVANAKDVFEMILDPKDVGQIGGGKCQLDKKFTVSSVQTLQARLRNPDMQKFLKNIRVWIIDEAHTCGDNSYYRVSNWMKRAYYRFGLTGSAFKKTEIDNMFARSILGDEIFSLPSKKLIDDGLLARPIIHMLEGFASGGAPVPSYNGTAQDLREYDEVYWEHISGNEDRNILIAEVAQDCASRGEKTLVLVSRIAHGEILHALLSPFVPTKFVSGRDDVSVRRQAIKDFEGRVINVLISSTIFDVGVDIPGINTIVLAGAGKSAILIIQRVGRGLRLAKGKSHCDIYDFYDRSHPFDEQVAERLKTYSEQGWEVVMQEVE